MAYEETGEVVTSCDQTAAYMASTLRASRDLPMEIRIRIEIELLKFKLSVSDFDRARILYAIVTPGGFFADVAVF